MLPRDHPFAQTYPHPPPAPAGQQLEDSDWMMAAGLPGNGYQLPAPLGGGRQPPSSLSTQASTFGSFSSSNTEDWEFVRNHPNPLHTQQPNHTQQPQLHPTSTAGGLLQHAPQFAEKLTAEPAEEHAVDKTEDDRSGALSSKNTSRGSRLPRSKRSGQSSGSSLDSQPSLFSHSGQSSGQSSLTSRTNSSSDFPEPLVPTLSQDDEKGTPPNPPGKKRGRPPGAKDKKKRKSRKNTNDQASPTPATATSSPASVPSGAKEKKKPKSHKNSKEQASSMPATATSSVPLDAKDEQKATPRKNTKNQASNTPATATLSPASVGNTVMHATEAPSGPTRHASGPASVGIFVNRDRSNSFMNDDGVWVYLGSDACWLCGMRWDAPVDLAAEYVRHGRWVDQSRCPHGFCMECGRRWELN